VDRDVQYVHFIGDDPSTEVPRHGSVGLAREQDAREAYLQLLEKQRAGPRIAEGRALDRDHVGEIGGDHVAEQPARRPVGRRS
jgi:hypothetical protein